MQSAIEESEPHLIALGRVAARWATLDHVLSSALGCFIGDLSAATSLYYTATSTAARLDMLAATLRTSKFTIKDKEDISKLIENLRDLWKRRNILLHNSIGANLSEEGERYSILRMTPLRASYVQQLPFTVKELTEHADAVSAVGDAIFASTVGRRIPPSE